MTEAIHNRFVAALTERLSKIKVGHAMDKETHIGPVVDAGQLKQDMDYIQIGRGEGAKLVFGGERVERSTPGFYLQSALFTEATNQMRIAREEIFGPVAAVIRVKAYDEALACANNTPFGLSARHRDHQPEICLALRAQRGGRHGDGEPAHGGRRFPCAIRRPQGLFVRIAGTEKVC